MGLLYTGRRVMEIVVTEACFWNAEGLYKVYCTRPMVFFIDLVEHLGKIVNFYIGVALV